jgi:hypothetical protein
MKNISKVLLFLFAFTILSGFGPSTDPSHGLTVENERIEVIFNSKVDFNDLVNIKLELSEHGIYLDYKRIVYDDYGQLREISFEVDCNDGFSGSARSDKIENHFKFGFYRDYAEGAKSAFGTGYLD